LPIDPESFTWDPLDGEFLRKLDDHLYVSLSRDRKLASQGNAAESGEEKPKMEPEGARTHSNMTEVNEEEMSLFDLHIPGAMTIEEIESQIDLDHWLLLVEGTLIHMIVSRLLLNLLGAAPCEWPIQA
jgi:arginyl-tRNA---protein transferase